MFILSFIALHATPAVIEHRGMPINAKLLRSQINAKLMQH
jgi:hypothetical protein